jgi:ribonucleoside-diphosphate reductase alpha chain
LDLFAGLKQPTLAALPSLSAQRDAVILSERSESKDPEGLSPAHTSSAFSLTEPAIHELHGEAFERNDRTPPASGIAPDLTARSGIEQASPLDTTEDRSIYHTASAMQSMYNMGDAPSCSTCGSIMTRNGSCYRCMECGSTSGCS